MPPCRAARTGEQRTGGGRRQTAPTPPAPRPAPRPRTGGPGAGGPRVSDGYALPDMGRVWSDEHRYELWCRVETLVLEAHAAAGRGPAAAVGRARRRPPPPAPGAA